MKIFDLKKYSIDIATVLLVVTVSVLFPGVGLVRSLVTYGIVATVTFFVYGKLCVGSAAARRWLVLWTAMLAVGNIINVYYYTTFSGGSLMSPVLLNNDAWIAWQQYQFCLEGTESTVHLTRQGYGFLIYLLSGFMPVTISSMLAVNMLSTLLSIVLAGAVAGSLVSGDNRYKARMTTYTIALLGSVCTYLTAGTLLIKDATCCLCMAAFAYALFTTRRSAVRYGILAVCIVFGFFVRSNFLPFMALAVGMWAAMDIRGRYREALGLVAILMGLFAYTAYSGMADMAIDFRDFSSNYDSELQTERLKSYKAIVGRYQHLELVDRIIRLPLTMAVQYLTPLPFEWVRDTVYGPTSAYAHFAFTWYAVGGVMIYYMVFCLLRSPRTLAVCFGFGMVAWAATAFATGGTVSRYCLPWLPFMVPAASWVLLNDLRRPRFRRWMIFYSVVLLAGLVITYLSIKHYSPDGWSAVTA